MSLLTTLKKDLDKWIKSDDFNDVRKKERLVYLELQQAIQKVIDIQKPEPESEPEPEPEQ